MALNPIYIDSATTGAQLSIGTTNASKIVIGPVSQSGTTNVSTVINGVRIDSHVTNQNLLVTHGNNKYKVTTDSYPTNVCNTAISNIAFSVNTMTGDHCTAVGHNCLTNNSTGKYNIAIGADTLSNVTTGGYNTALGGLALNAVTTDSNQVAIGYAALGKSVTTNYPNVAVGSYALQNLNNSACGANVAIGQQALAGLTNGTGNVAIGYLADNAPQGTNLAVNTTSSGNVIIGNQATSAGYTNCIAIGQGSFATGNNQIIIGSNENNQTTYIKGSGGLNVGVQGIGGLNVAGSATLGSTSINTGNSFTTNGPTIFGNNATSGFPTIKPGSDTGLVLGWNINSAQAQGDTSFLNYAQGGYGGFRFYTTNSASNYQTNSLAQLTCGGLDIKGTTRIYEAIGTGTITGTTDSMTGTAGSLVIEHGNYGGGSSIVFPSKNNPGSDYGYIRYRDDVNNGVAGTEQSRLEIGVENDIGAAGSVIDSVILQKNGGYVGIGTSNPAYTLDVTGTGRFTGTISCNNYDRSDTGSELLIGHSMTGGTSHVIRIGESITTGAIVIGNGNNQNGLISIGGSGSSARTITIGSPVAVAAASSPINLNGNVTLIRPLTLGSAPSDTTQLGGKITGTINTYAASPFNVASLTITTAGVYIFTFYIELTISATPTSAWINMTGTNMKSSDFGFSYINTANVCFNGSQVISATASGYSLTLQYNNGTGLNTNNCFFTATRIA